MAVAEGVDPEVEARYNEGVAPMGKTRTRGSNPPPGTTRQAEAAIVAGAFRDHAIATGDPGYLEDAQEAAAHAGNIGIPQVLDDTDREQLESGGVAMPRPSAVPRPLTEPITNVPVLGAESVEEEDEEADFEDEPDELPAHIQAMLGDEPEEDDEDDLDLEPADDYDRGRVEQDEPGFAEDEEYEDPGMAAVNKRLAKLEKENAYLRKQQAKNAKSAWARDAQHFPSVPPAIADDLAARAKSHKEYVRMLDTTAKAIDAHYGARPRVAAEEARTQATGEARRAVREAWGEPVTAQQLSPVDDEFDRRVAIARERDGLGGQMVAKGFARLIR